MTETFYTLTDEDTKHTNSRSERHPSFEIAERHAIERMQHGSSGVFILKAVALVKPNVNWVPTRTIRI